MIRTEVCDRWRGTINVQTFCRQIFTCLFQKFFDKFLVLDCEKNANMSRHELKKKLCSIYPFKTRHTQLIFQSIFWHNAFHICWPQPQFSHLSGMLTFFLAVFSHSFRHFFDIGVNFFRTALWHGFLKFYVTFRGRMSWNLACLPTPEPLQFSIQSVPNACET